MVESNSFLYRDDLVGHLAEVQFSSQFLEGRTLSSDCRHIGVLQQRHRFLASPSIAVMQIL